MENINQTVHIYLDGSFVQALDRIRKRKLRNRVIALSFVGIGLYYIYTSNPKGGTEKKEK